MEGHRGTKRQALVRPEPCSNTEEKPFLPFLPFSYLNFSNNFSNFYSFESALAAVTKLVVASNDILAGLWDLHSEALADILDMEVEYDILELPPPIIEETPQWMLNFMSSDREPANPGDASPPHELPDLPSQDRIPTPLPELTWDDVNFLDSPNEPYPTLEPPEPYLDEPLLPYMPELTWEDYLTIAGLEEIEQVTDTEDMPLTPSPATTPSTYSPVSDPAHAEASPVDAISTISPAEPVSSLEYQIQRRNWISKEKVRGNGACPVENVGHMLSLIPNYYQPESTFETFDRQFGIPKHLKRRWKNGVRLWPDVKFSKTRTRTRDDEITAEIVKRLLKEKIIVTTNSGPFVSSLFYILNQDGSKLRPIFNYKHLTKALNTPHFNLPSLYQVVHKRQWQPDLYYIKLDFKQAFFNLPIHPASQFITTFKAGNTYYKFTRLPFGISIAPFVCQMMLNQVVKYVRSVCPQSWGHIDDIIIAHKDAGVLSKLLISLTHKLSLAKWVVNWKKSVVYPTKSLTFLGAIWNETGVERLASVDATIKEAIASISKTMSQKDKEKVRGYLNYYLAFTGPVHSLINRAFEQPEYGKTYLYKLMECRKIRFKDPPNTQNFKVYTDATTKRLGWVHELGRGTALLKQEEPIMFAETMAAIIGAYSAIMQGAKKVVVFTDNMATRAFLRRGAAKFLYRFNYNLHFFMVFILCKLRQLVNLEALYINTQVNPADILTRLD